MLPNKKQIILLVISVLICVALFLSIYNEVKEQTIRGLNNRQMVYAELAASSIEESFNQHFNMLNYLAHEEHIIRMNGHGSMLIKSFKKMASDEILGITRLDAQGRIIYSYPDAPNMMGTDLSGQEHIREILQSKKPVVSDVFTTGQGFKAIAIHVPAYRGNTFDGTLGFLISFDTLAKKYLKNINIEKSGYAWMISAKGIEIYCPIPGHTGNSVMDNCKDFPDIIDMAREMMKGKKGFTTYTFDKPGSNNAARVHKHAVYLPVKIGNTFWSIVVATPEDTVLAPMQNFRNQLIIIILILLVVFAAIAYTIARVQSAVIEQQKRRQIEDDLIKSAQEFNDLYHNAPCGYHSLDSGGNLVRINDMELTWLGYTREELLGKSFIQVLSDTDRDQFSTAFARLKKEQGLVSNLEYDMIRKDGSTFPVLVTASAIRDTQGNFVMSRSMSVDVTLHREQEKRLRESEELYRTAMEKTNDGITITQNGKYVYANQKLLKTIGREATGLIGLPVGSYMTPADLDMVQKYFAARMNGENVPTNYNVQVIKPDGSILTLNISVVKITYQGNPATLSFVLDITDRKRTEEALRQSEERYRTIIESIDDDYFETDLSGTFTFINKPITWSGYSREELIGMNFRQVVTPQMAEKVFMAFNKTYRDNKPARILDSEISCKDGSTGHIEISASLIRNAEGNPTGFRGISRDVSEHLKMEEESKKLTERLYQAQKMEAIGTLAGGIAHDFNNLLMGIQGYTSLMLLEVDAKHPSYEQLKSIQFLVQSGASLTRQLLGFARVGRYEITTTNLNDLISKSINIFGRTKKEISIFEKYEESIQTVEVDRGQIEQVLLNIFVNAWQAMPGGGSLFLETKNVVFDKATADLHGLKSGHYVQLSITDTGVGMDEKTRQRIFDPFFTTQEMGRGTGLGLASAYGIIKGHAGIITAYSEKGHGTTFNIYLPVSSKQIASEAEAQVESEWIGGRETILLVDDEKVITEVTGRLLNELGYAIITAGSGEEAIKIYTQKHVDIDLVIIDMIMPGMNGSDTFDRIKAINPSVKVMLSSGYSLNGKAKAIMDKGVRVFLQKPYRINDLAKKIREALSLTAIG